MNASSDFRLPLPVSVLAGSVALAHASGFPLGESIPGVLALLAIGLVPLFALRVRLGALRRAREEPPPAP